ncbi:MAG TPA: branched-chain amino acid ABC transporter permease [Solirubrobacteraceae bacterium]|jgi:branched-chain amino acid transport system permease protein|nr:branched-chain amino acid ABC transporter permease [Solirubrobacteraceae bacterium]
MSAALVQRVRSPRALGWTAGWVVAILLPSVLSEGQESTATFVVIGAIGAVGLGVLTGYAGQISLGHAFFLGVGAYTGAVLGANHHWNAIFWIPAAGLVAALCGLIIAPTALRLRGLYLAIVTIGVLFIGQDIFLNSSSWTGGPEGREFPIVHFSSSLDFAYGNTLNIGGYTIDHNGLYYYLGLIILAISLLFVWNLSRTRMGRAMQAVRERELAASVMGIDLARTKIAAFVVSSFFAGICGALYGSFLSFAQPGDWDLTLSIQYLAAIIIGGMGTVMGPVLGAFVVFGLADVIKTLSFVSQNGSGGISPNDFSSMVYGVLIIGFLVVEPRGLMGLGARFTSRPRRRGGGATLDPRREGRQFAPD